MILLALDVLHPIAGRYEIFQPCSGIIAGLNVKSGQVARIVQKDVQPTLVSVRFDHPSREHSLERRTAFLGQADGV